MTRNLLKSSETRLVADNYDHGRQNSDVCGGNAASVTRYLDEVKLFAVWHLYNRTPLASDVCGPACEVSLGTPLGVVEGVST